MSLVSAKNCVLNFCRFLSAAIKELLQSLSTEAGTCIPDSTTSSPSQPKGDFWADGSDTQPWQQLSTYSSIFLTLVSATKTESRWKWGGLQCSELPLVFVHFWVKHASRHTITSNLVCCYSLFKIKNNRLLTARCLHEFHLQNTAGSTFAGIHLAALEH